LTLDLYLVRGRQNRYALFSPVDALHRIEEHSGDRIQLFLHWFMRRKNRLAAWIGRVINTGHEYYLKLEDKIDPQERVLKAMSSADVLIVHHASTIDGQVRSRFEALLKRQRLKHILWFAVDLVVSGIVILFTPFLAPIPGPNVFFYYPFLRLLSHYRAIVGAARSIGSSKVEFKSLPDISGLEDNLQGFRTFIRRVG